MTLENKYKEIMSHVNVDDEMRDRILANLKNADVTPNVTPITKSPRRVSKLTRIMPIAAAAVVLVIGGIVLLNINDKDNKTTSHKETVSHLADDHNGIKTEDLVDKIQTEAACEDEEIAESPSYDSDDVDEAESEPVAVAPEAGNTVPDNNIDGTTEEELQSTKFVAINTDDSITLIVKDDMTYEITCEDEGNSEYCISGTYTIAGEMIVFEDSETGISYEGSYGYHPEVVISVTIKDAEFEFILVE